MKTKIPQFELPTIEEAFNLAIEHTADGERLQEETEAAAKEAAEAKELQKKLQPNLL